MGTSVPDPNPSLASAAKSPGLAHVRSTARGIGDDALSISKTTKAINTAPRRLATVVVGNRPAPSFVRQRPPGKSACTSYPAMLRLSTIFRFGGHTRSVSFGALANRFATLAFSTVSCKLGARHLPAKTSRNLTVLAAESLKLEVFISALVAALGAHALGHLCASVGRQIAATVTARQHEQPHG